MRPSWLLTIAATCLSACGAQRSNAPPPATGPQPQSSARADPVQAKRAESIATVQRALGVTQDPEARAQLLFRLVGLHLDLAQECAHARLEIEDRMAAGPPEQTERLVEQAVEAGACAGPMRKKAAQILGQLLEKYPGHPRTDEHLFLLASTLMELGDMPLARQVWMRLIKDFPTSRYVPDAFLAFAEHYFNQAGIDRAIQFYEKVLQFEDSPLAPYARYKLAWCHFNLQEFRKALDGFAALARGGGTGHNSQIAQEALKDAVMAYAHVGDPAKAEIFFAKLAGGRELGLLERLSQVWTEQGRHANAAALDKVLIGRLDCHPAQILVQARQVRAQAILGQRQQVAAEVERLVQLIQKQQTCPGDPDRVAQRAEGRGEARSLVAELLSIWQRESPGPSHPTLAPLISRLRAALESLDRL